MSVYTGTYQGAETEHDSSASFGRRGLRPRRRSDLIAQPHEPRSRAPAARALGDQATACRPSERNTTLDRAPAAARPSALVHWRHEPLSDLRGRGLAARALRLALRGVSATQSLTEGVAVLRRFAFVRLAETRRNVFVPYRPQNDLSRWKAHQKSGRLGKAPANLCVLGGFVGGHDALPLRLSGRT
jgi:hypothetical protein